MRDSVAAAVFGFTGALLVTAVTIISGCVAYAIWADEEALREHQAECCA